MPIDLKYLATKGVSAGAYKGIATLPRAEWPKPFQRLMDQVANRIKDGFNQNFDEWRMYHAVDLAYKVPFNQTTPTLVQNILSRRLNPEETLAALEAHGLKEDELFLTVQDNGIEKKVINPPVFFQVFIPIVKAYCTVRLARIFNERNTDPFLPYKPRIESDEDEVMCAIQTDVTNSMARSYGWPDTLRQCILQMLKYGVTLSFPREEWHTEYQVAFNDEGKPETNLVRQGLRYIVPHPTQMYYDLKHPLTSLNTDSGVQYVGHWNLLSYGDVLDDRRYWNRTKIFYGTNWIESKDSNRFFQEFFPCSMKFPRPAGGVSTRDDRASWYNSGDRDKAIFLTNHYQKVVPKDWGLGDYRYPVWHRFVMANEQTPIYIAPMAYNPSWMMGYDYDHNADATSSFALECIPWQDHLGNILSQMMLTAKQNLANVVFYDTNLVDKKDIVTLRNMGESRYRSTQFIGFDSLKTRMIGANQAQAFQSPQWQRMGIQELAQLIPATLGIMERVLQISAQEAGGQGTHQQSKAEIQSIGGASQNRVLFTCSFVDEGCDAWKKQAREAAVAHWQEDEIEAFVPVDIENVDEVLKDMGFEVVAKGKTHVKIKGKFSKVRFTDFARSTVGTDQQADKETSQIIFSVIGTVAGQQDLHQKIGTDNLLKLVEMAAVIGGAPRGFRIRTDPKAKENGQVPENVIEAIKQAQQATLQAVQEQVGKPAAEAVAQDKQQIAQLQETIKKLEQIYAVAQKMADKGQIAAQESQAQMQIEQQQAALRLQQEKAEFEAEQARMEQEHQAEMRRKREQAELDAQITQAEVAVDLSLQQKKGEVDIEIAKAKADAAVKAAAKAGKSE